MIVKALTELSGQPLYHWAKQQPARSERVDSGQFTYEQFQSFNAVLDQTAAQASSVAPQVTQATPADPGTEPVD